MKFSRTHSQTRSLAIIVALSFVGSFATGQENTMNATPAAAVVAPHFVKLTSFDFAKILPAPPVAGSVGEQAEIEAVLQAQAWRTPEQVAWAKRIERMTVFDNADVLGAWFKKENLPATTALFAAVADDVRAVGEVAKKLHARPRPFVTDPRVQPCVEKPTTDSYPSGHSTSAFVWAALLAEVFPEKREALFEHAHRLGWGRVLGGVHYPGDLVAGRRLAEAVVAELRKSADFRATLEKCRAEVAVLPAKKAA